MGRGALARRISSFSSPWIRQYFRPLGYIRHNICISFTEGTEIDLAVLFFIFCIILITIVIIILLLLLFLWEGGGRQSCFSLNFIPAICILILLLLTQFYFRLLEKLFLKLWTMTLTLGKMNDPYFVSPFYTVFPPPFYFMGVYICVYTILVEVEHSHTVSVIVSCPSRPSIVVIRSEFKLINYA